MKTLKKTEGVVGVTGETLNNESGLIMKWLSNLLIVCEKSVAVFDNFKNTDTIPVCKGKYSKSERKKL